MSHLFRCTGRQCFLRGLRIFTLLLSVCLAWAPAAASQPQLRIGVLAFLGADAAITEWSPVLRHLERSLPGYQVSLVQLDHHSMGEAIASGRLDFVITNPGHYIELEATFGASRILTLDTGGGRSPSRALGSVVVVPASNTDMHTLANLRDKRLAIVGRQGFGGFQVVWGELAALEMDPERALAALEVVGFPMSGVIDAVLEGRADAGVIRTCLLETHPEWAARLRVLSPRLDTDFPCVSSTPLYPDWPFASLRATPPELARAVSIALLGMDAAEHGMAWAAPADYQSVHELFRTLEIGPYAYLRAPTLMVLAERYWPWVAGFFVLIVGWIFYTVRVEHLVQTRTQALTQALAARETLEARMRTAQEQAEHLSRLSVLGELSGTLAHELNQPLAAVTNYASSLIRRADNQRLTEAAVREAATEIADQAARAAGILSRIRLFARKRTARREPVRPIDVVQEAVSLFQGMMARSPAINLTDHASTTARVNVDRLQIQQVLLNLLKNAYDASRDQPIARQQIDLFIETASPTASGAPAVLRVIVRDYGSGLEKQVQDQLFEAFFTTKPDGLGLGLSICRSIAEAHGGRLSAETPAEGTGARFILSLPLHDGTCPPYGATNP